MRVLFCGSPAAGHLFPMLALMDAASRAGDEVVVLTGAGGAALLPGRRVLEAGPSVLDGMAEAATRVGDDGRSPGAGATELFGGVRVDLGGEAALAAARAFAPDLVVHELLDWVAVLVAADLEVPRVAHGLTGPVPPELIALIEARGGRALAAHGRAAGQRAALVDPFPEALLDATERDASPDRLAVRPSVHRDGANGRRPASGPPLPPRGRRPRVLVTLGTSVDEPAVLTSLVQTVLRAGADAVVTHERPVGAPVPHSDGDGATARWIGFWPLADLLGQVDAVLSAGGTGTLLAALSQGVPLVIRPFLADQPWNADRVVAYGVGIAIEDPAEGVHAVQRITTDPAFTAAARSVAAAIAATPDADQVWHQVARHAR